MTGPPVPRMTSLASVRELMRSNLVGPGLRNSTIRTLGISVAGAAVSFVGQVVLARSLGQERFGVYLFALAVMNAVMVLGKLELDAASTHFLSAYTGSKAWQLARGFIRWSRRAVMTSALLTASVGALLVLVLRDRLALRSALLPGTMLAACILLVLTANLMLNTGQLQALRWYVTSQWPGTVLRPGLLAITIGSLYFVLGRHPGPVLAVLINSGATLLALILTARFLQQARPPEVVSATAATDQPRWTQATIGFVATGLGQLILSQQADLIIVGSVISVYDSALYGAASQLAALVAFGQTSVNFVMAPMISDLFARNEHDRLQGLLRSVLTVNAVVTLPVIVALVVVGPALLRVYGAQYAAAYPVLIILGLAGTVIGLVGATGGFVLTMTAFQRQAAWIIGASALANIVLMIVLTARFGIIGTATATLLATTLRGALLIVFIWRRLRLSLIPGLSPRS